MAAGANALLSETLLGIHKAKPPLIYSKNGTSRKDPRSTIMKVHTTVALGLCLSRRTHHTQAIAGGGNKT